MDRESVESEDISEEEGVEEITDLNQVLNDEDDSSEGEEVTEEGVKAIERMAAMRIKAEEEKQEREQKKQIMDFKVRVAHMLELYLEKAPKLIDIDKVIDSILEVHS